MKKKARKNREGEWGINLGVGWGGGNLYQREEPLSFKPSNKKGDNWSKRKGSGWRFRVSGFKGKR